MISPPGPTGVSCLIPPKRLPMPAAKITKVLFFICFPSRKVLVISLYYIIGGGECKQQFFVVS